MIAEAEAVGRRLAPAATAAAPVRRWPSSTSSRRTATGSRCCRRTRSGLLDLADDPRRPRAGHARLRAAAPRGCSARSRQRCAGVARRARCTSSGSRPRQTEAPTGGERSFELVLARLRHHPHRARRTGRSSTSSRTPGISVLGSCHEGVCGTCETDRARGRGRPPRLRAQRVRAGGQRRDDGLRLALPRPTDSPSTCEEDAR